MAPPPRPGAEPNPQPAPPQPPVAIPLPPLPQGPPRTYRAFCGDASNDPYNGNYAGIMNEYAVPANGQAQRTPQALATQAYQVATEGYPMSYLMVCRASNAPPADMGKVVLVHCMANFPPRPGLPATLWDDTPFGFKGNFVQNQITTVERWNN